MAMTLEQKRAVALASARMRLSQQSGDYNQNRIDTATAVANEPMATPNYQDTGASLRPYEPGIAERVFSAADRMGIKTRKYRQTYNAVASGIEGAAQGLTFGLSDEIEAALNSGFGLSGSYSKELEKTRARMNANAELSPGGRNIGEIAGGLALGAKLPIGRTPAATLKGRVMQGIGSGALYGGAYGAGTSDGGLADRAAGATSGALFGGGIGAAIPVAGAGVRAAGNAIVDNIGPLVRSMRNPAGEASRRVAEATSRTPSHITAFDRPYIEDNGQQLLNVDLGGETTRALARSVANQNPEARIAITNVANDRFETQGQRAQGLIDRLMGGQVDDLAYQQNIRAAAQKANKPRYERAYRQGSEVILTPEMERITSSPAVATAIQRVVNGSGSNRAVANGFGAFNPKVTITQDGQILFNKTKPGGGTAYPDLQFWDYVKRELDDMANSAARSGNNDQASTIGSITRTLRNELDRQVPSYASARQGAAKFFDAEDALDAGRKFVTQNKDMRQSIQAMRKFSDAEREAFKVGFAAELRDMISKVPDRSNVIKRIWGTPQARQKIRAVLGQEGYVEFEVFTRVENTMDMLRNAVTGNSTTARQLVELGLGAGAGAWSGGDFQSAVTGAALVRGASMLGGYAARKANQQVMKKVADILLSDDPSMLADGAKQIAKSAKMRQALKQWGIYLENLSRPALVGQTASQ